MIWGIVIRFMLETFLSVILSICLNFYFFSTETVSETVSGVITIIIATAYTYLSFYAFFIFYFKRRKLKLIIFVSKYGAFYEELRIQSRMALLYNIFFMIRRLIFVSVIIILNSHSMI